MVVSTRTAGDAPLGERAAGLKEGHCAIYFHSTGTRIRGYGDGGTEGLNFKQFIGSFRDVPAPSGQTEHVFLFNLLPEAIIANRLAVIRRLADEM